MLTRIVILLITLAITACGGDGSVVDSSSSSSSSSGGGGGSEVSASEQAFSNTLYPILRESCAICHFEGSPVSYPQTGLPVPAHSDKTLAVAHLAASAFIDLEAPAQSRFVERLRDEHHSCGGEATCLQKAAEVESAIAQWANILNGGTVEPVACGPRFPQDLILLGDLPFINSIDSLLGSWTLEGRERPDAATKLFSQKSTIANTSLINTRLDWAVTAAENFQRRAAQISGCLSPSRSCARTFLEKTAHRGFKRPVASAEIDDLMEVFDEGANTSFSYGLKLAVQAILLAPSFNHRTEYGVENTDGNFELTPHELASTLSFLLTDTLPDATLMTAADNGSLNNAAELERQAARLLAMDSTKSSVEYTLMSAWNFGNLFGKAKDPETFPNFNGGLASQMYEETRLFLREHLWNGDINRVLTSDTTYVNGALADLYGVPFPGSDRNQFYRTTINDGHRAGILTQASFLTAFSRTDETSVVARGLFVNGPLLCLPEVPPPPESVIAQVNEQLESGLSEAELAAFRGRTDPCRNCHNQFDAYGLMFEQYDAIGAHRDYDKDGNAIHSRVDLSTMASFDGFVDGPVDFAEMLAGRSEFRNCVTRHLFAYGTGEDGIHADHCEVTNITNSLSGQSNLADIIKAIVKSPALATRVAEEN